MRESTLLRHTISGLICVLTLLGATIAFAAAGGPDTQDVSVTFTDEGEFSVSLSSTGGDGEGDATFGLVEVDALDDVSRTLGLQLTYTDTHIERGGGMVSLTASSFIPDEPVPQFAGSDQVDFQIPDRYLQLTSIGPVEPDGEEGCAAPGVITTPDDAASIEGSTFEGGGPLTIAKVSDGCGIGSATQSVMLTLTVPAGVYPTDYSAVLTVETTVDESPA